MTDFIRDVQMVDVAVPSGEPVPDPLILLEQKLKQATSDVLVELYMRLRSQKEALDKEYNASESAIKAKMEVVERVLGIRMSDDGVTSIKTKLATVFQQIKRYCQCDDWSAFNSWVVDNKRPDLFQRRLNNTALLEIVKDTNETPPGVQVVSLTEVVVRKQSTKGSK